MGERHPATPATPATPGTGAQEAADEAGLLYVTDSMPGIRRRRAGRGFGYVGLRGQPIRDPRRLAWFKRLAIPPAWSDVWICPSQLGHIQATGRDAKGRKVYRYHPRWRDVRDADKYRRMVSFGRILPKIRRRVRRDLGRPGLPREKVLAAVISLLERTRIRVGNDEYARQNRSFGLTTLQDRHATVTGSKVTFTFNGKSGRRHEVELKDPRLARIVGRSQELPGTALFGYVDDDGERRRVTSDDVNAYLRELTGSDFSAKDFRTWAGTVLAAWALAELEEFDTQPQAKHNVVRAVEKVAEELGNTSAVSRTSYVHPEVISAYLEGDAVRLLREEAERRLGEELSELSGEEAAVLALLRDRLSSEENRTRRTRKALGISSQAAEPTRSSARR